MYAHVISYMLSVKQDYRKLNARFDVFHVLNQSMRPRLFNKIFISFTMLLVNRLSRHATCYGLAQVQSFRPSYFFKIS